MHNKCVRETERDGTSSNGNGDDETQNNVFELVPFAGDKARQKDMRVF
jgi:hypothetical protein